MVLSVSGVKNYFQDEYGKSLFYIEKKKVDFIDRMKKIDDGDIIDKITTFSRALFLGGSFLCTGSLILTLAILNPKVLTIGSIIMLPLLFVSLKAQMVFWVFMAGICIFVSLKVFMRELKRPV